MLDTEVSRLIHTALRDSTVKVYHAAQKSYLSFCSKYGYSPLPLVENTLLKYVSYLSLKQLSYSTVKVYYAGIKSYSISNGYGLPSERFHQLNMAFRSLEINSTGTRKKLPITLDVLEQIRVHVHDSYNDIMLWSAMTLAHYGLLRAAEFTVNSTYDHNVHLSLADVSFHNDEQGTGYLKIYIKRSKTDKRNQGFYLHIGCSTTNVCAYCAMVQYYNATNCTCNSTSTRALFVFSNGAFLSRSSFINQVKLYLALAGIDTTHYSAHSFRIGGATTAAAAGLSDWEIQILGRWSSNTYQRYIRTPTAVLVGFAHRMTQQHYKSIYNIRSPYVKNVFG